MKDYNLERDFVHYCFFYFEGPVSQRMCSHRIKLLPVIIRLAAVFIFY